MQRPLVTVRLAAGSLVIQLLLEEVQGARAAQWQRALSGLLHGQPLLPPPPPVAVRGVMWS